MKSTRRQNDDKSHIRRTWPLVIITHKTSLSVWISSQTQRRKKNTSIQVYNKRRSKDRYRWKQKKRREYIFTSSECVMLRKNRDTYIHIHKWKISYQCCLTTFWCFEQEQEMAQKWQRTERENEKKRNVKYIYNRDGTRL